MLCSKCKLIFTPDNPIIYNHFLCEQGHLICTQCFKVHSPCPICDSRYKNYLEVLVNDTPRMFIKQFQNYNYFDINFSDDNSSNNISDMCLESEELNSTSNTDDKSEHFFDYNVTKVTLSITPDKIKSSSNSDNEPPPPPPPVINVVPNNSMNNLELTDICYYRNSLQNQNLINNKSSEQSKPVPAAESSLDKPSTHIKHQFNYDKDYQTIRENCIKEFFSNFDDNNEKKLEHDLKSSIPEICTSSINESFDKTKIPSNPNSVSDSLKSLAHQDYPLSMIKSVNLLSSKSISDNVIINNECMKKNVDSNSFSSQKPLNEYQSSSGNLTEVKQIEETKTIRDISDIEEIMSNIVKQDNNKIFKSNSQELNQLNLIDQANPSNSIPNIDNLLFYDSIINHKIPDITIPKIYYNVTNTFGTETNCQMPRNQLPITKNVNQNIQDFINFLRLKYPQKSLIELEKIGQEIENKIFNENFKNYNPSPTMESSLSSNRRDKIDGTETIRNERKTIINNNNQQSVEPFQTLIAQRAFYSPHYTSDGIPSPQFKTIQLINYNNDMIKNFYQQLHSQSAQSSDIPRYPVSCPISECQKLNFVSDFCSHLRTDHSKIPIERLTPGKYKCFFMDPRTEELGVRRCQMFYLITDKIRNLGNSKYKDYLPLMVMSTGINFTDLVTMEKNNSHNNHTVADHTRQYDFIMIWLTGLYPEEYPIFYSLTVWSRDKLKLTPEVHNSNSSQLYSIRESMNSNDIYKSGQMMLLSLEQCNLLTHNGQDMIEFQITIH